MQVVKWMSVGLLSVGLGTVTAHASDQLPTTNASGKISEPAGATSSTNANADNTVHNKRDREDATLTPGDQGHSKTDRQMTAKIRRAIMKDKQLSMTAKNIKIITIDGKVTLRGPVKTAEERSMIDLIVQQAGPTSLDNQLEVETPKK
ncbi:MAG: BON domain-containing protein [Limisphaerales bacterium]